MARSDSDDNFNVKVKTKFDAAGKAIETFNFLVSDAITSAVNKEVDAISAEVAKLYDSLDEIQQKEIKNLNAQELQTYIAAKNIYGTKLNDYSDMLNKKVKLEAESQDKITEIGTIYYNNMMKQETLSNRAAIARKSKDSLEAKKKELLQQKDLLKAQIAAEKDFEKKKELGKQFAKTSREEESVTTQLHLVSGEARKLTTQERLASTNYLSKDVLKEQNKAEIVKQKEMQSDLTRMKSERKELEKKGQTNSPVYKQLEEAIRKTEDELKGSRKDNLKASMKSLVSMSTVKEAVGKSAEKISKAVNEGLKKIDQNITTFYSYQAKMEARLQGSDTTYKDAMKMITKNVGLNGYVKQTAVLENLRTYIDAGIAYNVEMRAFLGTISEDIASTFNAMDKSLMRIVRLQQEDSTAQRLGMEAHLTQLFNKMFSDTSYLSNQFDTVTDTLLDASTRMDNQNGMEFEYVAQKWLGSMYSLGMSDQTISKIAEGLKYLGTGDVEAMNSNSALQTLFAMSANRANKSYADLMINGLTAEDTNDLLKSMVEYLSEIASGTKDNNVVAKAYSNVLGITITDYKSIQNLEKSAVDIYNSTLNYGDALEEYYSQTQQISKRVHMSQIIGNLIDNAISSTAVEIGNNVAAYGTWMGANLIKDLTGGIAIPAISIMGNMVDLETTVMDLVLGTVAGVELFSSIIGSLSNGVGVNYEVGSDWGYKSQTSRGSGPLSSKRGVQTGFSESNELNGVSNVDTEAMTDSTIASASEKAEKSGSITNKNVKAEHTLDDLWDKKKTGYINIIKESDGITLADIYDKLFKNRLPVLVEDAPQKENNEKNNSIADSVAKSVIESTNSKISVGNTITNNTITSFTTDMFSNNNELKVYSSQLQTLLNQQSSASASSSVATNANIISNLINGNGSKLSEAQMESLGDGIVINYNYSDNSDKSVTNSTNTMIADGVTEIKNVLVKDMKQMLKDAFIEAMNEDDEKSEASSLSKTLRSLSDIIRFMSSDVSTINTNVSTIQRKI